MRIFFILIFTITTIAREEKKLIDKLLKNEEDFLLRIIARKLIARNSFYGENVEVQQESVKVPQESETVQQGSVKAQQENVTVQQENVGLQQENVEVKQKSGKVQQENVEVQQKSVEVQQKSGEVQQETVEIQQKSMDFQQEDATVQQESVESQQDSMEFQQESVEASAELKRYHVNGTIPTFQQYYRQRFAEQEAHISKFIKNVKTKAELMAEMRTVENLRGLFEEWVWYTVYSIKLEKKRWPYKDSEYSKNEPNISLADWYDSLQISLLDHYQFIRNELEIFPELDGIETLINDVENQILIDHEAIKVKFKLLEEQQKLEEEEKEKRKARKNRIINQLTGLLSRSRVHNG